jgi:autotransporter-associated beta strand protein
MKKLLTLIALAATTLTGAQAQTSFTSTSATTAWNASRWNNSTDAAPYTSTFTANNAVNFTSGSYSFAGMGATVNVGNISLSSNVTVNFASIGNTFATGGNVRTIDVGSGALMDFQSQAISTAAGTGFIKNGSGVLALAGGTYAGGFTVNSGTVILRGVNAMGDGGLLTLNGGTVAGSATRNLTDKYDSGIVVGGNVQFGELATNVTIASSSANLTFNNNVNLGSATRTFTQGNNGSNTFAANAGTDGRFELTNTANTFTGDININGGEVRFTTDGSMGNAANDITIDGGRFAKASDATTVTLGAGRTLSVGDGAGTSISSPGSGVLVYNGVIANKTGETGAWAKQGGGTLQLGGVSTYTGATAVNNGILQLTTGNDRLPTGTVVSLGQAASTNVGTLDLNGRNQQIAGLSSTTGTNASASNNTVTSGTAATLTIDGSGTTSYGDGTDANSGVITGAISLVKNGTGTQTLGDANTYTGSTTVNNGTLIIAPTGTISNAGGTNIDGSGKFIYNNVSTGLSGSVTVSNGGTFRNNGANLIGTLNFGTGGGSVGGSNLSGVAFTGTNAISANRSITPGNSTGTASTGAQEWATGGTYVWEINDATGTAGSVTAGWDLLNATGGIDVTAAVAGFTIQIVSLDGSQVTGLAANFDNLLSQKWLIADTDSAITSFALTKFNINATSFQNALNPGGFFSVARGDEAGIGGDNTQIFVTYTIPEPSTYALLGLGLLGIAILRRKQAARA